VCRGLNIQGETGPEALFEVSPGKFPKGWKAL
jgi:hypothetical protein